MGCVAMFFGGLWGSVTFLLYTQPLPAFGFWGTAILEITRELLFAATVVLALTVVWCIAMPSWVERLFSTALSKLYLAIAIGTVAIMAFATCRALWHVVMQ
jgi:hypothetical protein